MASGARSSGNAGEAVERLLGLSEQRFLAGDLAGAQRAAREAQARCRTPLPDLAHALAAYEVHAAATSFSRASGKNWYAVLSVTHEDIKRRYRRLCLALHPDKNRSAAADGAFKLLQEAWKALSARHPPAPSAEAKPRWPYPAPPAAASRPGKHARPAPQPAASSPKEAERRRGGDKYCNSSKPRPPPPRVFRSVLCGHCGREFRAADDAAADEQKYCVPCRSRPREEPRRPPPPPPAGADTDKDTPCPPPARRGSRRFPCPARCAHCGAGYASTVSVGMWHLHCASCHRYAKVHVRSPSNAEAW
ncbi:unnamed protein product [Alopecurus aequalis]